MLSTSVGKDQRTWDLQLPMLMLAYRTSLQETTAATPFSLMFGCSAQLPIDLSSISTQNHQDDNTDQQNENVMSDTTPQATEPRIHHPLSQLPQIQTHPFDDQPGDVSLQTDMEQSSVIQTVIPLTLTLDVRTHQTEKGSSITSEKSHVFNNLMSDCLSLSLYLFCKQPLPVL